MKKLFIEDWKREGYSYETVFEGELYHLVKDKNAKDFKIIYNKSWVVEPTKNSPIKNLSKMTPRREELLPLNEKRFEVFNKDPI